MKHILLLSANLLFLHLASAQDAKEFKDITQPKTKLEEFCLRTGTVIITASDKIGVINADSDAIVAMEIQECTDISNGSRQAGIVITVSEKGAEVQEARSFVDVDEIPALIKGIDEISAAKADITKMPFVKFAFATRGNLNVSLFPNSRHEFAVQITVGWNPSKTAFVTIKDLSQLRALLQSSLNVIQKSK